MNEALAIGFACSAGTGIGAFYFSGLWFTLKGLHRRRRPGVWLAASFILRTLVSIVGFYLVMAGEWQRLAGCIGGFLLARSFVMWRLSPKRGPASREEGSFHGTQAH